MMIYVLFGLVTLLMLISIVIFDRDVTAPSFLLTASFWIATFFACLNSSLWNFENEMLIGVVISGLSGFIVFSSVEYLIFKRGKKVVVRKIVPVSISNFKLCVYLFIQLFLYAFSLVVIIRNVGQAGALSYLVNTYYELNRTGDATYTSSIVNIGNILNFSGTYYILYVAINNIKAGKKNSLLIWLNVIVGMIGSLLTGTKTAFFMFGIAGIVFYILLTNKENGWKKNINFKMIVKLSVGMALGLALFGFIDTVQGRTIENITILDKIATYIGAPIKNLELFLTDNIYKDGIFGAQTLSNIYADIYKITGNDMFDIQSLHRYRWIFGIGLGNVYTMFMPLYYDFGFLGMFFLMGMLGFFSQRIYDRIKYNKCLYDIDFRTIFYGYLAFAIIFSFFSNKFFECIFSKTGIYFIIGFLIFDTVFKRLKGTKLNISIGMHKITNR